MLPSSGRAVVPSAAVGVAVYVLSGATGIALAPSTNAAAAAEGATVERIRDLQQRMAGVNRVALRAAIDDTTRTVGTEYPDVPRTVARLDDYERRRADLERGVAAGGREALATADTSTRLRVAAPHGPSRVLAAESTSLRSRFACADFVIYTQIR